MRPLFPDHPPRPRAVFHDYYAVRRKTFQKIFRCLTPDAPLVDTKSTLAAGEYQPPKEMLTDNGREYVNWRGVTRFQAEMKKNGIHHFKSRPHHPMTLGKIERFWETIWQEFLSRAQFESFESARDRIRLWIKYYNHKRALSQDTKTGRYTRPSGGSSTNLFLRCLHNLALGMGWLTGPILPSKLWPISKPRPKRGITLAEHQLILDAEHNEERRRYYEMLWAIGAAQTDTARLTAEDIDWTRRVLQYQRKKTGGWACIQIGPQLESLLGALSSSGPLFPQISRSTERARASEFCRRCRTVGVKGVSLHSYRYAWPNARRPPAIRNATHRTPSATVPVRFTLSILKAWSPSAHPSKVMKRESDRSG